MQLLHHDLTEKILAACFQVSNELGAGFKVIVELKAVNALTEVHKAQIINYLKATGVDLGLLVNFGNHKLEFCSFANRLKQPQIMSDK
jgi:hypothetical protein